ncbi:Bug family tripartite tricarboxylate transporter substrate binding protein [Alcaligenes endophyticus]|uniref:Tripartite tricarboxylate transporter substrate binding protein n=1 Tax=Alcaligenes endophyticus TaxID=1929088 RepID=A0ABT8EJP0_9BURK|nr:tripartite tricarboxylate transporter substrate binding protein [Alcaligenes endophyticus]MCX5591837.1 tripartite tricarboxylate transporter substrate binding protein [Alcaligenes endophyticus]MDN4121514.1 tripartite tricarboxylate transporter substrate binding protein [Alcaligenes endophyticus]
MLSQPFKRACALGIIISCALVGNTHATEKWPQKSVSFIVPSAAGGSPDVLSRLIMNDLAQSLDASFIVENRPGAAGNIGILQVKKARPDGYTLGYGNINTLAVNNSLFNSLPYDVDKDLRPVAHLFNIYNVLVVSAESPITSVKDLIQAAKSDPGQLSYGAAGVGTTGHMGGELFKHMTDIDVLYVPYNSGPAALQDLVGGRLDFMFSNSSEVAPLIASGRLRALGVSSKKRLDLLPDVPSLDEAGVTGYETIAWGGMVAPKQTPDSVIDTLNQAVNNTLKKPKVIEGLAALGAEPAGGSAADFQQFIQVETDKWAEIIASAGIEKLD